MPRCFIIGPIGDRFAPIGSPSKDVWEDALEVFEKVILPACIENELEPVRADQIAISGEITEQIFRHLYEDDVVIADVSGGNRNVMYELGLRHTRDLLTIQIGEYGQLPFDLAAIRTIMFSRSDRGLIDARKSLAEALRIGLAEGSDGVTATRIWGENGSSFPLPTVERDDGGGDSASAEEVDEDGLLERMATVEESFPRLGAITVGLSEIMTEMGSDAEALGRDVEILNSSNAPASARLGAIAKYSHTLQEKADNYSDLSAEYISEMKKIDRGVNGVLEYYGSDGAPDLTPDSIKFLNSVVNLARTSREAMESLGSFATLTEGLGQLSRTLKKPGTQISRSIREISSATSVMDAWEAAAARILERHPEAPLSVTLRSVLATE